MYTYIIILRPGGGVDICDVRACVFYALRPREENIRLCHPGSRFSMEINISLVFVTAFVPLVSRLKTKCKNVRSKRIGKKTYVNIDSSVFRLNIAVAYVECRL